MKINKFRNLLVLAVMLCFLLTGCINTNVRVVVDENDGGSVALKVLMEKSAFEMFNSENGKIEGLEDFEQQEPIRGEDGKTYIPFVQTKAYMTYAELEKGLLEMDGFSTGEDMSFEYSTQEVTTTEEGFIGEEDTETAEPTTETTTEVTTDEETPEKETQKLFSEVQVTKQESLNGYIYTFRAVLQKQGEGSADTGVSDNSSVSTSNPALSGEGSTEDTTEGTSEGASEGTEEAPIDLSPVLGPIASNINDMFKVQLEIVLPTEIQESAGGVVQGNTLVCDIKDLSVDTEIYASGELVLVEFEPVDENYNPEFLEIEPEPTVSPIMIMGVCYALSAMIVGTLSAIVLGILKLVKRR